LKIRDGLDKARKLVDALEEKKAIDIILIDIHEVASFTDYFIICSGSSNRMLRSLIDTIEETATSILNKKGRAIGIPDCGWIAIDLGDYVIHIFSPDQRAYYNLEELWSAGKILLKIS
jgi:ribosome-associated protein